MRIQLLTSTAIALTLALAGTARASIDECPKKGGADCVVLIGIEAMVECMSSAELVCEPMFGSKDYESCYSTQTEVCQAKATIEAVVFCDGIFIKDDHCFKQEQGG